ncbi:probable F420-dependent oxidoreductase, Rv3520c family [Amycolatopsis xylanica]|uniref:Probable F420-dependent oxidoreductase, Rv3520c family n=1 Tax=Amycolatopsis xylanica TaxID=589385 RepID=A0A1H3RZS6_9PSEU|nr:LLM class F420-dependent oxidoreductase [Amycolatopsis xylanica]SDZ31182.1 probable F420-dependent oxidoreductase, Rv3520c family [Amycolatopsis xylanica]
MRVAIQLSAEAAPWRELVDYVVEAERMGVDLCWVAEAWGCDAASPLGYLAAKTERMLLGSGVLQIGSRSPVLVAMTALTLARMTEGRFLLGLGASGPQVIEGLHGTPFAHPLGRTRETVEIIRQVFADGRVTYAGKHFELPLPGGDGKAIRLNQPPNPDIPIYLATLSPAMLKLTGAVADGWLGTSFVPEAASAYLDPLAEGAASAGREMSGIDICQGAEVAFGDNVEEMVAQRKPGLAFSLGGMGSAGKNFYNDAYARLGFAEVADRVRQLWVDGRRDEAAAAVPDEMVLATTLIGTETMVRKRLRAWQDAGVNTVRLYPAGETLEDRITTLGRALELMP